MTKQEFEQLKIELETSGMSLKSFMATKGLPIHQFHYWRKKYCLKEPSKSKMNLFKLDLSNHQIQQSDWNILME